MKSKSLIADLKVERVEQRKLIKEGLTMKSKSLLEKLKDRHLEELLARRNNESTSNAYKCVWDF